MKNQQQHVNIEVTMKIYQLFLGALVLVGSTVGLVPLAQAMVRQAQVADYCTVICDANGFCTVVCVPTDRQ